MTVFRKSWLAFVSPTIGQVLCVLALIFGIRFINGMEDLSSNERGGMRILVVAIVILIGFRSLWRVFWLRSVRLAVSNSQVNISGGILPWNKFHRYWMPNQIYEASFIQPGFLGWLFRYGTVRITGKEGSTRDYDIPGMSGPDRAASLINNIRDGRGEL